MADEYIRKKDAIKMCGGYGCLAHLMSLINPADVVPVVHARWRHYEGMYVCEDCGAQFNDESPFCPMCGAKMDGKRREE